MLPDPHFTRPSLYVGGRGGAGHETNSVHEALDQEVPSCTQDSHLLNQPMDLKLEGF